MAAGCIGGYTIGCIGEGAGASTPGFVLDECPLGPALEFALRKGERWLISATLEIGSLLSEMGAEREAVTAAWNYYYVF